MTNLDTSHVGEDRAETLDEEIELLVREHKKKQRDPRRKTVLPEPQRPVAKDGKEVHTSIVWKSEGPDKRGLGQESPTATDDLRVLRLPTHQIPAEVVEEGLRGKYREYAQAYPERAKDFARSLVRYAEELGLASPERTLGLREAARRIASRTGDDSFSDIKLRRYFDSRIISIGIRGSDGLPKFSEYECDSFVLPPKRQPGPKPKQSRKNSKETS